MCAPGLENGTGRAQAQVALEGLQELEVIDYVVGACYDTTASNSSPSVGTVAVIEMYLDRSLFKFPCRHHIIVYYSTIVYSFIQLSDVIAEK